jgi:hypothetical protein
MSAFEQITTDGPNPRRCPENIVESLRAYVSDRRRTGGFLEAVLENDLTSAISRADPVSLAAIRDIICFCYEELPSVAWGSPAAVRAWLGGRT